MAGDNKLTFDPLTRLPELTQNWTRSSHGHSTPSLKISCKSAQPFSRNVADNETNKETKKQKNKERNRSKTIPRPPTGGGVKIYANVLQHFCTSYVIMAIESNLAAKKYIAGALFLSGSWASCFSQLTHTLATGPFQELPRVRLLQVNNNCWGNCYSYVLFCRPTRFFQLFLKAIRRQFWSYDFLAL